jgi:DnaJ-class molecular chaperone
MGAENGGTPRRLEVKIPAGVQTGSRVRVAGEGLPEGGRKGDLFLVVDVLPHERFERKGDDLHAEIDVPLSDAVLGGEVTVEAMGRKVALKVPPLTQNGRVIRLAGLGMPKLGAEKKGDLYVRVRVKLPEKLDGDSKKLFEELKALGI